MEIVDSQVHLNLYPSLEAGIAAMDAAGVDALLYDEFGGYDANERRHPSIPLSNGSWRVVQHYTDEAVQKYPDRFARVWRIARNDPELDWMMSQAKSTPDRVSIRVTSPLKAKETKILMDGGYMDYFAAANKYKVPVFVLAWGKPSLLVQYAEKFPDLQFIIDHCGVEPLGGAKGEACFRQMDETIKLAKYKNIALKWAHVPQMSEHKYPFPDVMPHFLRMVDAFTPQRVMWASDATMRPVCSWAETYFYIRDTDKLSAGDKEWILGKTVRTLLNWKKPEKARGGPAFDEPLKATSGGRA